MQRTTFILILLLLSFGSAQADIQLISFQQEPELATVRLRMTNPKGNIQSELTLQYKGTCDTLLDNGTSKAMLSNRQASIVALNFWGGSKINDAVAISLLSDGRVAYF